MYESFVALLGAYFFSLLSDPTNEGPDSGLQVGFASRQDRDQGSRAKAGCGIDLASSDAWLKNSEA